MKASCWKLENTHLPIWNSLLDLEKTWCKWCLRTLTIAFLAANIMWRKATTKFIGRLGICSSGFSVYKMKDGKRRIISVQFPEFKEFLRKTAHKKRIPIADYLHWCSLQTINLIQEMLNTCWRWIWTWNPTKCTYLLIQSIPFCEQQAPNWLKPTPIATSPIALPQNLQIVTS